MTSSPRLVEGMAALTRGVAATAVALLLTACTDADGARRALEAQGVTNIAFTGYRMFGCGKDDSVRTGFTGVGLNGKPVAGVVCSQLTIFGKSSTVRFD